MGIGIELYRLRIGLGAYSLKRKNNVTSCRSRKIPHLSQTLLTLNITFFTLISLLLLTLSGNVELNPGPRTPTIDSESTSSSSQSGGQSQNHSFLYLNARSLKSVRRVDNQTINKITDFQNLLYMADWFLVAVTETWLKGNILDSELAPSLYQVFRKDRTDAGTRKRGGGLMLLIRKPTLALRRYDLEPDNEIMVCDYKTPKSSKKAIIVCYRPQWENLAVFSKKLDVTISKVKKQYSDILILGDFNVPNIPWLDGAPAYVSPDRGNLGPTPESQFCDAITKSASHQMNQIPSNSQGNMLDLILSTSPQGYSAIKKYESSFRTDHAILTFDRSQGLTNEKPTAKYINNYKKADFANLNRAIHRSNLCEVIMGNDINTDWNVWLHSVHSLIDQYIPKVKIKDSSQPPWIDSEVRHLKNKKLTQWRRCKKLNDKATPQDWLKFRRLRNQLQHLLDIKHKTYLNSLELELKDNPKRFWSFFKAKTKARSLPSIIKCGGQEATTAPEKSEIFNNYFYSVFTAPETNPNLPIIQEFPNPTLGLLTINGLDVYKVLKNMDPNKALGPDNISPRVLKECASSLAPSLTKFFNLTLRKGSLPDQWKCANVVPIHKKDSKEDATHYRPISLLCVISKVMERCIFNIIYPTLELEISDHQHGFLKGKSTSTQMATFIHELSRILDDAGQVDVAYLDFSKAFDSVSHTHLLHKLKGFGIHGELHRWFCSYLSNRFQRVSVEGENSSWLPVISGVPQGSILGPLLFLLFINDMPDCLNHSEIALFADDSKCYKRISSIEDCQNLQEDINHLFTWSNIWRMKFNASKCTILSVTRKHNPVNFNYTMNNTILEKVKSMKDLGVWVTHDLIWSTHCEKIIAKGRSSLAFIKRAVGFHAPQTVSKQLYISMVRSILEYCPQVWSSASLKCSQQVESIQRQATKYILNYPADKSYKERLMELNILPLCYRREMSDLVFYFKSKVHEYRINTNQYCPPAPIHHRLRSATQEQMLQIPRCRTKNFKRTYFNRIVHLWNCLPVELKLCSSTTSFKYNLKLHYRDKLRNIFSVEDTCTWTMACSCDTCFTRR